MTINKKYLFLLTILILISSLALSACGKKSVSLKAVPAVTAKKVKIMDADIFIKSPGYFLPYRTADVSARTAGQVVKIYARDGDYVKAGQVLAVIDRTKSFYALQAQRSLINKDEANLALAKSTLGRDKFLYKKALLTSLEYDTAVSNYKMLKAVLKTDRSILGVDEKNYRDTLIVSRINGIVNKRIVNLGDYFPVNKVAYEIVALKPLELEFHVAQEYAAMIKNGQKCYAAVSGYPNKIFKGKIYFISPQLNPQTRMFRVKAMLKNKNLLLRPQLSANVKLKVKRLKNAMFVPQVSVRSGIRGDYAFLYKNGRAILTKVLTGITKSGYIQIVSGVTPEDEVILKGANLVHNDEKVKITE